jgi:hypothetical protein
MRAPFYEQGKYACKVTDQALGEAKTGAPQFVLQFTVLGQVDPADPSRYIPAPAHYTRTFYRAITEKTIGYFMEDLKTLGFTGDSFKDLDPNSDNFQDFRGRDIDMYCGHEKDQEGNLREKWGVARTTSPLEVKPLESKKVRELDNLFAKHLKAIKPAVVAPKEQAATENRTGTYIGADEDVPF